MCGSTESSETRRSARQFACAAMRRCRRADHQCIEAVGRLQHGESPSGERSLSCTTKRSGVMSKPFPDLRTDEEAEDSLQKPI
jgi:hypothetical protein